MNTLALTAAAAREYRIPCDNPDPAPDTHPYGAAATDSGRHTDSYAFPATTSGSPPPDPQRLLGSPIMKIDHHDLDHLDRLLDRYRDPADRGPVAVQIVEALTLDQLLSELRCLRERDHGPCPDPDNHTHAAEA